MLRSWEKFCPLFPCRKKNTFFRFTPKIFLECTILKNFLNGSQAWTTSGIFPYENGIFPNRWAVCHKKGVLSVRCASADGAVEEVLLMVRLCERSERKQACWAGAASWPPTGPLNPQNKASISKSPHPGKDTRPLTVTLLPTHWTPEAGAFPLHCRWTGGRERQSHWHRAVFVSRSWFPEHALVFREPVPVPGTLSAPPLRGEGWGFHPAPGYVTIPNSPVTSWFNWYWGAPGTPSKAFLALLQQRTAPLNGSSLDPFIHLTRTHTQLLFRQLNPRFPVVFPTLALILMLTKALFDLLCSGHCPRFLR